MSFKVYVGAVAVLAMGVVFGATAFAGIPEPPQLLCGQVFDSSQKLVTEGGQVEFVYHVGPGKDVSWTADLKKVESSSGLFSYITMVPLETPVGGVPDSADAIPVKDGGTAVTRNVKINFTDPLKPDVTLPAQAVTVTAEDIASAKLLDLNAQMGLYHSGDINKNHVFEIGEILAEIELFTATDTHDYQCGFPYYYGTGLKDCTAHSGDYCASLNCTPNSEPDFVMSLSEILRMIELFTATDEHWYHPDASEPDGFDYGTGPKGGLKPIPFGGKSVQLPGPMITGVRTIVRLAGSRSLVINVSFSGCAGLPLTAFGIQETLPPGWVFEGIVGDMGPVVPPSVGQTGRLDFLFLPQPTADGGFTYQVGVPETEELGDSLPGPFGEVLYRVLDVKGEQRSIILNEPGEAADTDRDGIPDFVEGIKDTDGDGIPDYLDPDADGDNIPDALENSIDEVGYSVSSAPGPGGIFLIADFDHDGIPNYLDRDSDNDSIDDAVENRAAAGATNSPGGAPGSTDGLADTDDDGIANFVDEDSNNDGVSDSLSRVFGLDPYNMDGAKSVPLAWGLMLFVMLGFCVILVRRYRSLRD